ncbi:MULTISPECIES: hypothetical protein [Bacillales]|uniref:hypothetical protein n=1 Tax=Bacillales TaxID=1385 RepID=UPI0005AA0288|nr:hypothetical protein [Bacillus ndiopicus]
MEINNLGLLLASLTLFVIAYRNGNKEPKELKTAILLGIAGLLYILFKYLDYSFMALLVGVVGVIILFIHVFSRK